MVMFLMALCLSIFGLAVTAIAFGAATRDERREQEVALPKTVMLPEPRFFARDTQMPVSAGVPLEVLLLQIERHVRLEQAAAESFIHLPTRESLHQRTLSPLVH
jgi:hypothetical protein